MFFVDVSFLLYLFGLSQRHRSSETQGRVSIAGWHWRDKVISVRESATVAKLEVTGTWIKKHSSELCCVKKRKESAEGMANLHPSAVHKDNGVLLITFTLRRL